MNSYEDCLSGFSMMAANLATCGVERHGTHGGHEVPRAKAASKLVTSVGDRASKGRLVGG